MNIKEKGKDLLNSFFDHIEKVDQEFSLDKFLNSFSQKVDNYILTVEKNERLKYGTGRFIITLAEDPRKMNVSINFYFLTPEKEIVHHKLEEQFRMKHYLNDQAIAEIQAEKKKEYSIDHPHA